MDSQYCIPLVLNGIIGIVHSLQLVPVLLLLSALTACTTTDIPQKNPASSYELPAVEPSTEDILAQTLAASIPKSHFRTLSVRVFPRDAEILVNVGNGLITLHPMHTEHDVAWFHTNATSIAFRSPGYKTQIQATDETDTMQVKLEREHAPAERIGELSTGNQPKSVRFSPDGRYLFTTHLNDKTAVSQYQVQPFRWIRNFHILDTETESKGFVESIIVQNRSELWVTQMTRNSVHVFSMTSGLHLATITLSGIWPKVLAVSPDEKRIYISCWLSDSVSVVDVATRKEIQSFATGNTPRGLSLSPNGNDLLVTRFSGSAVDRIDLDSGKRTAVYDAATSHVSAMRHIVYDANREEYYITAMGVSRVYRLSKEGKWLGFWKVGRNPNTCDISPDGRWLIVSCRGPNNPDTGYLTRGYEYGKIYFIDLEDGNVSTWIWGQDQPTGLDISPNGRYFAFTNLLSHNIELYRMY